MPAVTDIELPNKLIPLFSIPRGGLKFRGAYGGRGSGKSVSFALMSAVWGYKNQLRILCTRDTAVSIRDSFHAEVKSAIAKYDWLAEHYEVGEKYIRGKNGTEYIFKGLKKHTTSGIKSTAKIDIAIVEEAEDIVEQSWRDLIPTVRNPLSEIWVIWNPKHEKSPVNKRFRDCPDKDVMMVEMNWQDNPWFSETTLPAEQARDKKNMDEATYNHIWEGKYMPAVEGAIYQKEIAVIISDGRYRSVPHDPLFRVHTVWDLGVANNMRVVMVQKVASELRIIDHIAGAGITVSDHVKALEMRNYRWGRDFIPHDGAHNNGHTGKSTEQILKLMGRRPIVMARDGVEEGIRAAGEALSRMFIDKTKCAVWFESIKSYKRKFNEATGEFTYPIHDEHSHDADTLRYIAMSEKFMTNDDRSATQFSERTPVYDSGVGY
jgi:phage terminase large subunit